MDERLISSVPDDATSVVFVEGMSDRAALETLAQRRDRDLPAEGVAVVSIGGSKNIRRFLDRYGPQGRDLRIAGLCDAAEVGDFQRALERAGLGTSLSALDLEALGFFVCDRDLEDELIRAVGAATIERIFEARGDLGSFRTFQRQPAQRGRSLEEHLHRFMGTHSGRKIEYAGFLVEALDLDRIPRPLDRVLAHV
jgi:hypothetical protein